MRFKGTMKKFDRIKSVGEALLYDIEHKADLSPIFRKCVSRNQKF